MPYTISGDLAGTIQYALQKRVIPVVRSQLKFAQLTQEGRIEPGTDRLRFVKFPDVAESTAVLPDEVSSPAIEALPLLSYVEITPTEIGRVFGISRRARNLSAYDLVELARDRLAFDAARRIDTIVRDVLATGGVVMYGGDATSRVTVDATDTLKMVDARKWLVKREAADLPGNSMVAITHPFVVGDLMSDTTAGTGWLPLQSQAGRDGILNGEVGSAYGTRFVTTTRAKTIAGAGAGGITVYLTFVGVGPWAIGSATVEDLKFRFVTGPDKTDPLDRTTLLGYYMDYGAGLIETTRYIRFESAATAV